MKTYETKITTIVDVSDMKAIVEGLAHRVANEWSTRGQGEASGRVKGAYMLVDVEEATAKGFVVSLDGDKMPEPLGTLAIMYEEGVGPRGFDVTQPWDVKRFLLAGKTAVDVPFERTEGQISSYGPPGAVDAARKLSPPVMGRGSTAGAGRYPKSASVKIREHHVATALARMVRVDNGESVDSYRVWRRAVDNGKPWIRPGIKPLKIAEKLVEEIPDMFAEAVAASIQGGG